MNYKMCAMMAGAMIGCSVANAAIPANNSTSNNTLVLYYSQTETTKTVAEEIQHQLGNADIAAIEAVEAYPADYDATIARWRMEVEKGILPEIKPLNVNLDNYSTIFLGFPVWGGTYAQPVITFVSENKEQLAGKTIVSFATFGSGGLSSSTRDLVKALPESNVSQGYGVRQARLQEAPKEVNRFLIEGGYVDGSIDPLPEYSEQLAVTDEDVKIFNDACSGYRFPLGTPITVGKRTTADGIDYKFIVKSTTPRGEEISATIFVTLPAAKGARPEFTLVER